MYKFNIIFGTEKDAKGNSLPKENMEIVEDIIYKQLVNTFGGFSTNVLNGFYKHKSGEIVTEASLNVEILTPMFQYQDVLDIAERIKAIMEQESVILLWGHLEGEFL